MLNQSDKTTAQGINKPSSLWFAFILFPIAVIWIKIQTDCSSKQGELFMAPH